jgi:electron transport complex protein RnfA
MNEVSLILLITFSCFMMNPVLQCALGINAVTAAKGRDRMSIIIKLSVIFMAVILLWVIFYLVISVIISGIFIYVLVFPVGYMVYEGLDFIVFRYVLKRETRDEGAVGFPGGITSVALFICIFLADSFIKAFVLTFGFTGGALMVYFILGEIYERASLEAVPVFLRGKPLFLISMGMLSLVFSTVSVLIFRIIGD